MHGYNYHFAVDPEKATIKLKPTNGTRLKAFLPPLVVAGGFALMAWIGSKLAEDDEMSELNHLLEEEENS